MLTILTGAGMLPIPDCCGSPNDATVPAFVPRPVLEFCDPTTSRWAFKATVFKSRTCQGFVGYRRRGSIECLSAGPRRRDAGGRNPGRQSGPAQGLRHRHLLGRGARFAIRVGAVLSRGQETASPACQTGTTAAPRSATGSASSFASTNSMPTWSSPTPSISAAPRPCAKPPGSRSRTSSPTWPTGPRKTAMPCSASSTAISAAKEGAA